MFTVISNNRFALLKRIPNCMLIYNNEDLLRFSIKIGLNSNFNPKGITFIDKNLQICQARI